ncbi:MAG: hypothetical protein D6730_17500 [Bacteroidetes bacterium]|nr:MAG: hypothetical protein D6730_17500 [Bacteroidota bacterium]
MQHFTAEYEKYSIILHQMKKSMKNNLLLKAFMQLPLWARFALPAALFIFFVLLISSVKKFVILFFWVGLLAALGYGVTRLYAYASSDSKRR